MILPTKSLKTSFLAFFRGFETSKLNVEASTFNIETTKLNVVATKPSFEATGFNVVATKLLVVATARSLVVTKLDGEATASNIVATTLNVVATGQRIETTKLQVEATGRWIEASGGGNQARSDGGKPSPAGGEPPFFIVSGAEWALNGWRSSPLKHLTKSKLWQTSFPSSFAAASFPSSPSPSSWSSSFCRRPSASCANTSAA